MTPSARHSDSLADIRQAPLFQGLAAVRDSELQAAVLAARIGARSSAASAVECEPIAAASERGDDGARLLLAPLVAVLTRDDTLSRALRRACTTSTHPALLRLLGPNLALPPAKLPPEASVVGVGRPLTLGERKSLARRAEWVHRLLNDPHPDVIARVLASPKITEVDIVRLVAKRPGNPFVLAAIARSAKWMRSARVRTALCAHPQTPPAVAAHIAPLLLMQELRDIVNAESAPAILRRQCRDLMRKRAPSAVDSAAHTGEPTGDT
jgi:hypothetical protein